jgi:hypothetical protein
MNYKIPPGSVNTSGGILLFTVLPQSFIYTKATTYYEPGYQLSQRKNQHSLS